MMPSLPAPQQGFLALVLHVPVAKESLKMETSALQVHLYFDIIMAHRASQLLFQMIRIACAEV